MLSLVQNSLSLLSFDIFSVHALHVGKGFTGRGHHIFAVSALQLVLETLLVAEAREIGFSV